MKTVSSSIAVDCIDDDCLKILQLMGLAVKTVFRYSAVNWTEVADSLWDSW